MQFLKLVFPSWGLLKTIFKNVWKREKEKKKNKGNKEINWNEFAKTKFKKAWKVKTEWSKTEYRIRLVSLDKTQNMVKKSKAMINSKYQYTVIL